MYYSVQACCKLKYYSKYVQNIPDRALVWMKFEFIQQVSRRFPWERTFTYKVIVYAVEVQLYASCVLRLRSHLHNINSGKQLEYQFFPVTGTPDVCVRGYYGSTCQSSCSASCLNGTCRFSNGHCDLCPDGYYGQQCKTPCPIGCMSCSDSTNCSKCHDGWYGSNCEKQCLQNCRFCTSMSDCIECNHGWFGPDCDRTCPHCGGRGFCEISSGLCSDYECEPGWMNATCNTSCPEICTGDRSCDIVTGECLHGWRSVKCVSGKDGYINAFSYCIF